MPTRLDIPHEQRYNSVEFVNSAPIVTMSMSTAASYAARLLYTQGDLAIESGVPTIRAHLDMTKFSKGKYILGISGDPFFAYCTVDVQ